MEFVLRIHPEFIGDMEVSIYVPGTSIRLPEGSVTELVTDVSQSGSLPGTGHGPGSDANTYLPLAGALAMAGTLFLGGASLFRKVRQSR